MQLGHPAVGYGPLARTGCHMNISAPRATGCLLLQKFSICATFL